jgi:hypothetical protein
MGHGGFANPPTGTRPVPSGRAGLGLAHEGPPLHLHISATSEQGSMRLKNGVQTSSSTKPVHSGDNLKKNELNQTVSGVKVQLERKKKPS